MSSQARILVVDDERSMQEFLELFFRGEGYEVTTAGDIESARLHLEGDEFDVVITDLRMPRVGGREFFDMLKRERPSVADKVVFCTGDTVDTDTLNFLENVDRPHIKKPFTLGELRTVLSQAVGEHGGK